MPQADPAREADAIIVGAGAAGMMGALVAAHRGARVIVIERDFDGPSNLRASGGLFPIAGSRWQREAGITDSPEQWAADIRAKAAGSANDAIIDAVVRSTQAVGEFFAEALGIDIHLAATVPAPGHAVPRLHATAAESGRELHAQLREALARSTNITVWTDTEAIGLVAAGDRVAGVNVRCRGEPRALHACGVLLANGGFAADPALLAEFIPAMAHALHIGAGINDGAAIHWGRALGAAVAMMDGYQGQGHVNEGGRTRLGMGLPLLGAFLVNRDGHRFIREDIGPSELGAFVLAQPGGVALEVFDTRCHEAASRQGPYKEAVAAGHVRSAPTLDALATKMKVPAAALAASLEAYCAAARGATKDALGRTRFAEPLRAPFYAAWVTGALAHTQGGLAVDQHARVCRPDGSPIEGLFAAGGAAASLAGRGGEGYLPGNGLGQSFGLGLIAGEQVGRR